MSLEMQMVCLDGHSERLAADGVKPWEGEESIIAELVAAVFLCRAYLRSKSRLSFRMVSEKK